MAIKIWSTFFHNELFLKKKLVDGWWIATRLWIGYE